MKSVTLTADDFGLTPAVNEAVERAHRDGCLQAASLMVAAPAAEDAVRIARRNPSLRVGLHLVVIEGPAALPSPSIPRLLGADGEFPSDQVGLGMKYFLDPGIRRQLAAEIGAQFEAFARTGLALDHLNAHKHMHLHPTVAAMALRIGRAYGLTKMRVPAEPPAVMTALGVPVSIGDRILYAWTMQLRRQAKRHGVDVNDHCFGLAWSGHMTPERVRRLLTALPEGQSELYFHPASRRDATLTRLMPDYEHEAELAALLDPEVMLQVRALRA
jgi:hopanoid biosynthesis associated protein HpnK